MNKIGLESLFKKGRGKNRHPTAGVSYAALSARYATEACKHLDSTDTTTRQTGKAGYLRFVFIGTELAVYLFIIFVANIKIMMTNIKLYQPRMITSLITKSFIKFWLRLYSQRFIPEGCS
jgi:hypothetical protein